MTDVLTPAETEVPEFPGRWTVWEVGGETSVILSCPGCGLVGDLGDHNVHDDGTVNFELICPDDDCGYVGFVQLEGWDPS